MVCLYIAAEVPLKAIMKSTRTQSNFLSHCSGYNFVGLASAHCSPCFLSKNGSDVFSFIALSRKYGSCNHTIPLALSKDFEPCDPSLTEGVAANLKRVT